MYYRLYWLVQMPPLLVKMPSLLVQRFRDTTAPAGRLFGRKSRLSSIHLDLHPVRVQDYRYKVPNNKLPNNKVPNYKVPNHKLPNLLSSTSHHGHGLPPDWSNLTHPKIYKPHGCLDQTFLFSDV
jgi:hypothetical protein